VSPRIYLRYECGATKEETEFLVSHAECRGYTGQRGEINAMTSEQLIAWLDRKLAEHEVTQMMPDEDTITAAYKRAVFLKRIQTKIEEIVEEIEDDEVEVPGDLIKQVKDKQADKPLASWDHIVWDIANDDI